MKNENAILNVIKEKLFTENDFCSAGCNERLVFEKGYDSSRWDEPGEIDSLPCPECGLDHEIDPKMFDGCKVI